MPAPAQGSFVTPRPVHRAWGQLLTLKASAPAAGANWQFVAPAAYLTRIISLRFLLTASAQVANRLIGIQLTDGAGNIYYNQKANHTIAANVTANVSALPGVYGSTGEGNASQVFGIPDVVLPPGFTVEGNNEGLQTEDAFTAPVLLVEQFEPDQRRPLAELVAEVHEILRLREAMGLAAGA